jgi:hypothetical protein
MPRWLVPAVCAAVAAPLVAAAIAQHGRDWHPVFDLAMTEVRVRDVGSRHTPLVGLQGRIGPTGSHPGPISFYLLAPIYRLAGSTSFALQLATACFHAAAGICAVLVASRWRDGRVVVGVALAVLLLAQGYGLGPLVEPWNPHLPVLWFFAFLVAAWRVVLGDLPVIVPAVLAASICAQTHVPYLAVTLGLGGLLVAAIVVRWRQGEASAPRWLLIGGALGLLLWTPPLVDQVWRDPGNLGQIVDHLGTPQADPIGVGEASDFVVERLDGWQLVVGESQDPGTYVRVLTGPGPERDRGIATIAVWAVALAVSLRGRHRSLLALHGVVGAGAAIAMITISRIYGVPWPYLMLWVFSVTALMVLVVVGTLAALLGRSPRLARSAPRWMGAAALAALAVLSLRLVLLAPDARTDTPEQTAQLSRIVDPTVEALDARAGAATGSDGRYLVTWSDAGGGGALGLGMVNELIRHGYDVGVDADARVQIGPGRVRSPEAATAEVVVASGGGIELTAERSGAVRVAYDDPRTAAERADAAEARELAIEALERIGREDLVPRVDTDVFGLALNEGLPPEVTAHLARILDIGLPVGVFLVPHGAAG